ncbi:MAG: DnaA ATPase domain-containing protein [Desulfohalobiaceae bacterium]
MPEHANVELTPKSSDQEIKEALREHLRASFKEQQLRTWFDPLGLSYSDEKKSLSLRFPHQFFADWFFKYIREPFEKIFYSLADNDINISYGNLLDVKPHQENFISFVPEKTCTFDSFLVNKKNYFPFVSAREISNQQTVTYNPFIISGTEGTGKSHLIKAIANGLSQSRPGQRFFCCSVDDLHSIYQSFPRNQLQARAQILGFDSLLIDDLQQLEKFDYLQQELISIFNAFHDQRKQMVFGVTGRIACMDFFDSKLKSRLEWGLMVTLKQPDLEIRLNYVEQQSRLRNLNLSKSRCLMLAQHFQNFRALQGIMVKLVAYKELVHSDLTDKDYRQILDSLEDKPVTPLTPERIISCVAQRFQLEPADLESSRRQHQVVLARQVAMYLCRQLLGLSYPRIGSLFGGKDHSTALYAVKKIKELQGTNKDIKNMLTELEETCRTRPN